MRGCRFPILRGWNGQSFEILHGEELPRAQQRLVSNISQIKCNATSVITTIPWVAEIFLSVEIFLEWKWALMLYLVYERGTTSDTQTNMVLRHPDKYGTTSDTKTNFMQECRMMLDRTCCPRFGPKLWLLYRYVLHTKTHQFRVRPRLVMIKCKYIHPSQTHL